MAERTKARKSRQERGNQAPRPLRSIEGSIGRATELDRLIHERLRLGIVSALAVSGPLGFTDLRDLLETSDGNLSVHARKLEEAGYIGCEKSFVGRTPHTEFKITTKGRKALKRYLDHMEALISVTRDS